MASITGQLIQLQMNEILIGWIDRDAIKSSSASLHHSTIQMPNFVGLIQQLIINRQNLLEMARHGQLRDYNVTADFGKRDKVVTSAATFKSRHTFVGVAQLKAYSTLNLHFQFKTLLANGLLLFNGGKGHDFLAVEIVQGHLHFLFNLGDGSRSLRSSTRSTLNDNKWHSVTISRPSVDTMTLMVDDQLSSVTSSGTNVHLDLDGLLFIGGVRRNMYEHLPKVIQSKHGYEGKCRKPDDRN